MEEICNSLDSCTLCTTRGCHWLLKIGRCIWEGKGKVANEVWECDDGTTTTTTTTTTTHHPLNAGRQVPGTVDQLVQTEEVQHLALVIVLGISLGLVLLGGVALGVHLTLQRRMRQQNTSVSHTRLVEAIGYESDTLMSRIRRQLTPRPAPLTPPVIPAPPQSATPLSSSSSSSPSPNSTTAHSQFSTPSSFASPTAEAGPSSSSTPLLHGHGDGQGTQTHYFDSTPEYPDDLEMVDLTPSPQQVHKSGYNLRSHKK